MPRINRLFAVLFLLAATGFANDKAPEWLLSAAHTPFATNYSEKIGAVILLEQQEISVDDKGQSMTHIRRAIKILRSSGEGEGKLAIYFDHDKPISNFHAWSLPTNGKEYDLGNNDTVDSGVSPDELYSDSKVKFLTFPQMEPGSVLGYEYDQKNRSEILQHSWAFQYEIPVLQEKLILRLPAGWKYQDFWENFPPQAAQSEGDNFSWTLNNVPAIEVEPSMPAASSVAGELVLSYYSPTLPAQQIAPRNWSDVGRWYSLLTSDQLKDTPDLRAQSLSLTASSSSTLGKIETLAAFVQKNIRYVAIEIGIGGFQPHSAGDIYKNRYGDCKDKVTLLRSMLADIGVESYYILVNSDRGVVSPSIPSLQSFNHVIVAIRLPDNADAAALPASVNDQKLGRILYFDPTDDAVPFGTLPGELQSSYGLLVAGQEGELIELPLMPPANNELQRSAKLVLAADGTLSGDVDEIRTGEYAFNSRARVQLEKPAERTKAVEEFLTNFLAEPALKDVTYRGLDDFNGNLALHYSFSAQNYAKNAGDMLLVRPRVLGEKEDFAFENSDEHKRAFPFVFDVATRQTDDFDIVLPAGYTVEDLPDPVTLDAGFASYSSKVEFSGNVLHYHRLYEVNELSVPASKSGDIQRFLGTVQADEENTVVLKRISQTAAK